MRSQRQHDVNSGDSKISICALPVAGPSDFTLVRLRFGALLCNLAKGKELLAIFSEIATTVVQQWFCRLLECFLLRCEQLAMFAEEERRAFSESLMLEWLECKVLQLGFLLKFLGHPATWVLWGLKERQQRQLFGVIL